MGRGFTIESGMLGEETDVVDIWTEPGRGKVGERGKRK